MQDFSPLMHVLHVCVRVCMAVSQHLDWRMQRWQQCLCARCMADMLVFEIRTDVKA